MPAEPRVRLDAAASVLRVRGFNNETEVCGVLGENFLRAFDRVWDTSALGAAAGAERHV